MYANNSDDDDVGDDDKKIFTKKNVEIAHDMSLWGSSRQ